MKLPEHLSPSGLETIVANKKEYYLAYLSDNAPPKFPQTKPMSVGSMFDIYVKCELSKALGLVCDPGFDALVESQIDANLRDYALPAGRHCYAEYVRCGAYADLLKQLSKAKNVRLVNERLKKVIEGVPILGIPDLTYVSFAGTNVVLDWKVNGYDSVNGKSPTTGYVLLFDPGGKNHYSPHKECHCWIQGDIMIDLNFNLLEREPKWGRQLCAYSWLAGFEPGAPVVVGIEQLACKPGRQIAVAQHRIMINESWQRKVLNSYKDAWDLITSGHYFRELSVEASAAHCAALDKEGLIYSGNDVNSQWLRETFRGRR